MAGSIRTASSRCSRTAISASPRARPSCAISPQDVGLARLSQGAAPARQGRRDARLVQFQLLSRLGLWLVYPQVFPHAEAARCGGRRRATVAWGRDKSKVWLQVLNDHWLGPRKTYLCGGDITIADFSASPSLPRASSSIATFRRYRQRGALGRGDEGAAELCRGLRGVQRLRRFDQGPGLRGRR